MRVSAKHVTIRKAQKAQALPLPRMVRGQTGDPSGLQKVGAKSGNLKEGVDMAKRYCNAVKADGTGSLQYEKVGV